MYHVKCRDMLILLSQQKEQRVKELGELGDVIPPAGLGHSKAFGRIVDRLTAEAVVT